MEFPDGMNPPTPEFIRRATRFPLWQVLGTVGLFIGLIGSLLGTYFYLRHTRGVPMIAGLQSTPAEAVTRIVVQPARGGGHRSANEVDSDSLTASDVEITDPERIRAVMTAIHSAPSGGSRGAYERTDTWECNLLIETRDHTWHCHAACTDKAVYLGFWSNGLSGWAIGDLRSSELIELLPRAANVTPH